MILESNFPYSTNTARYRSNEDPLLVDFVKELLHVKIVMNIKIIMCLFFIINYYLYQNIGD